MFVAIRIEWFLGPNVVFFYHFWRSQYMRLLCDRQWSLVVRLGGQSTSLTAHCTYTHICTVACRRGGGASTSTYTYLRMSTCRHRRGCEAGRGWARWHLINCRCWPRYWVRGHAVSRPAATCTNWHWNTFYAANCRILLIAWIVKLENLPLKACLLSSSGICIVSIFNSFQMHLSVLLSI